MNSTKKSSLNLEITLILLVKVALIFGIWWFFFRTPDAPTAEQVSRAVLQSAPTVDNKKE